MDANVKSAIFEKELSALKREQAFGPNYVKKSFDLAVAAEMYQGAVEKLRPTAHLETSSQGEIIPPTTFGMSGLELALKEPDLLDAEVTIKRSVLADKAGVFEMAFETAQSVKAKNSIQRMQAHQLAAAHKYAMELMAEASNQRDPIFSQAGAVAIRNRESSGGMNSAEAVSTGVNRLSRSNRSS
jgi:hypothetical protein